MTSGLRWLFVNFLHSFDMSTYSLENRENKTKQNPVAETELFLSSFLRHANQHNSVKRRKMNILAWIFQQDSGELHKAASFRNHKMKQDIFLGLSAGRSTGFVVSNLFGRKSLL